MLSPCSYPIFYEIFWIFFLLQGNVTFKTEEFYANSEKEIYSYPCSNNQFPYAITIGKLVEDNSLLALVALLKSVTQ